MASAEEPRRRRGWLVIAAVVAATIMAGEWFWLTGQGKALKTRALPPPRATVAAPAPTVPPSAGQSTPPDVEPPPRTAVPVPRAVASIPTAESAAPDPSVTAPAIVQESLPAARPEKERPRRSQGRPGSTRETVARAESSPKEQRASATTITVPLPEAAPPAKQDDLPRVKEPDPSPQMFRLGVLYQRAGDHRRAVEQYRAVIALDGRHVPALNNLAVSLRYLGELEEAADVLRRATAVDPTYDKAFTNLGVVQQLLERSDAAIEAHLRALAINGQSWESSFNLGLLFWEAQDLERASQFFQKTVSLHSHASALYHLGLIAERQGRSNEAIRRYRQALQEREGAQANLLADAERRLQGLLGQVRR